MAFNLLCCSRIWRFNTTIWCDRVPVPFVFLLVNVPSDHFPRDFHTKLLASCILHLSNMNGPMGPADLNVNTTRVPFLRIYCHIVRHHVSCFNGDYGKNAICIAEHLRFRLIWIMSKFFLLPPLFCLYFVDVLC